KIAAQKVLRELRTFYADANNRPNRKEVPFTLLDTSQIPDVTEPLRAVAAQLHSATAKGNGNPIRKVIASAADADPALIDVDTLCRKLSAHRMREPSQRLAAAVKTVAGNGRVSLFCFPFDRRYQKRSIVAAHSTRDVYDDLAIVKTGWNKVALEAIPRHRAK